MTTTNNPEETTRLTPAMVQASTERAVSDKAMAGWQAAAEFTPSKYAEQILYPGVEAEVRIQLKGRLTGEIDGEIKARSDAEHQAMRQLSPQEIGACYQYNILPTEYLENKQR